MAKHGISFEEARQVLFDPFVRLEDASTRDEQRYAAFGFTENVKLLFVVHILWHEKR